MPWECAECNSREGDAQTRIDAVCHHCGKPLCRGDRVQLADIAFAPVHGRLDQTAVHCKACWRRHHRLDLPLGDEEP